MTSPADIRVLIGCEQSGVVRRAFDRLGFDAWSCDLLPAEDRSNRHMQCDIREILDDDWDFLAVMHPPCFAAGTLITTKRGFIPIEQVREGDIVLTHKGRWRAVTKTMTNTSPQTTVMKSSNGLETITTPEHPYYARHRLPYGNNFRELSQRDQPPEFVGAGKLTTRHFTASVLPPEQVSSYPDDELWLMGRYVADGHMRKSRWTEGKYEEMVISVGKAKLDDFKSQVSRKANYSEQRTATRATFYGHDRIEVFAQFGHHAAEKNLPEWVLSLPRKQAIAFLNGYLSGDGYLTDTKVTASTVSKPLILGLVTLFHRVYETCPCIRTSLSRGVMKIEGREVNTRDSYQIEIKPHATRKRNYIDGIYAWGHVRKVHTQDTAVTVYNLSVSDDESYIANGLAVHNCTRLCNSGVRWLHKPPKGKTIDQMWNDLYEGAALFSDCLNAPIPHVCVENPVMHKHAKDRIRNWIKPQTIQPWWFGDPAFKATGLYLRALPPLVPTRKLTPPKQGTEEHKLWSAIHRAPPGPDRWKFRSRTFQGLADAMADQWGSFLVNRELEKSA